MLNVDWFAMRFSTVVSLFLTSQIINTRAHILMISVNGANGVVANQTFGLDPNTPRNNPVLGPGVDRGETEVDTLMFTNGALTGWVSTGPASGCGFTLEWEEKYGRVDMDCHLAASKQIQAAGGRVPTSADEKIVVTMYQVNVDGGGPLHAFIDMTGTGNHFQIANVTKNIPGANGFSDATVATYFTVIIRMPEDAVCQPLCLVRVQNPNAFGGIGAFTDDENKIAQVKELYDHN